MQFVISQRAGIAIVSGRVINIRHENDVARIKLQNIIAKDAEQKAEVWIDFRSDYVKNMKLRIGSFILASVENSYLFGLMRDGVILEDQQINIRGYKFYYSGELLFDAYGHYKEETYVFGSVSDAYNYRDNSNKLITVYTVTFRSGKDNISKTIKKYDEIPPENYLGRKIIAKVGKELRYKDQRYHWSDKMVWC